ncbi:site-specific DNA-methyltransferase [Vibrio parahaemolyticus]|uniref:site-specific DNA-methyltransferase n=1 Tax=Vibrio parahaemolyticus TaxID=670 RepID=UPI0004E11EDC|nr:site-specific DNA-methyltransferase [Vibrio parahaemolyticus]MDG3030260.1 site-specific DNA-methyltransferase [Vibrio parahaemolyticus]MDK9415754.1 site-specific DNA-methyltransferase [Vibrio parahaemolyticus]MDK9502222.1 site-specific DNA-methyltransferase [Vibrio parahaemolyticus]MRE06683.1 site-specific DNA-methyltransferase [Vibrio parahaemolyticus]PJN47274.1 site-specific DNA-methyltransferase [Vibrio parahaemolyticus]
MPTLDFKGKQFVYSHHLSVPFRELKVVADKSLPQQGKAASLDDNLIIHGDNLEALKALLPTHAGKVDCIFIDPPYNTGNEGWCYNDNVRSPLMQEWLKKSANPVDKEDMERHDKWLCMMWPRLILLRELLNENGSIFITIGDDEQHALRLLLDEIFGRENFITSICWKRKVSPSNDAEYFSSDHDWLLVYAKNQEEWSINRLPMNEGQLKNYTSSDDDERGAWSSGTYTCNKSKSERPNLYYGITNPNTGEVVYPSETAVWKFSQEKTIALQNDDMLYWGKDGKSTKPRLKKFLSDAKGVVPRSVWDYSDSGSTQSASIELSKIFNGVSPFPTPKPSVLISKILKIATDENSIILDSFAGSGTTAHAVLEANKSDEGNRKFILIECEDYADEVTAERVRRVINGYPFKGNQKQELLSEKITWSVFEKKHAELLEKIAKVEEKHSNDFDKIKKELKDGVLTVTGERKVDEFAPGIGGSFTYCTLGEPIQIESLLTGEAMPSFDALARYVFYTATGQSLETVAKASADGFIGETDLFRIHLFYRPDSEWLRSNEAALNAEKVEVIAKNNATKKRTIVFAVAKFMSQKDLTEKRIEFCQLPYAIHRIMGA